MKGPAARALRSDAADAAVREAFDAATRETPGEVAILATGGYGRRALSPFSDLDLVIATADDVEVERAGALARAVVGPLRAGGWRVDHTVRSVERTAEVLGSAPFSVMALAAGRLVAGDAACADATLALARARVSDAAWDGWSSLAEDRRTRARRFGWLGSAVEPQVKDSVAGVRDATVLWSRALVAGDREGLSVVGAVLDDVLDVRDAVHETAGWRTDRLTLVRRPAVVARLGGDDADLTRRLRSASEVLEPLLAAVDSAADGS